MAAMHNSMNAITTRSDLQAGRALRKQFNHFSIITPLQLLTIIACTLSPLALPLPTLSTTTLNLLILITLPIRYIIPTTIIVLEESTR
jgi:hypothetical protein